MEKKLGFSRKVWVRRTRDPMEILVSATDSKPWICPETVSRMPGAGSVLEEVEVFFFNLGCLDHGVDEDELEREYGKRGLVPADPFALAAVNEEDEPFSNQYPNGTHWRDEKGRWCICRFSLNKARGQRQVDVGPRFPYRIWERGKWWFAGLKVT